MFNTSLYSAHLPLVLSGAILLTPPPSVLRGAVVSSEHISQCPPGNVEELGCIFPYLHPSTTKFLRIAFRSSFWYSFFTLHFLQMRGCNYTLQNFASDIYICGILKIAMIDIVITVAQDKYMTNICQNTIDKH